MLQYLKSLRKRAEWKSHGWCNVLTLCFITLALLLVFVGLPILGQNNWGRPRRIATSYTADDLRYSEMAKSYNTLNQPLVPDPLPIDPDTPDDARTWTASDGSEWKLVFSDEFNEDGRTFYPGDDKHFEAVNIWYWATEDLEWYDPEQAVTKDGKLQLTMIKDSDKHPGFNFVSAMIQSWNKFCFQGGYLEVKVSLPGDGSASGFWPAAWALGNLGRAGYGATTDGLWPYTYNSCDEGVLVHQTNPGLSNLPGQRLNACVCKGDHPSPGIGRGAPEIDIFEGSTAGGVSSMSMSLQLAPFDYHYQIQLDHTKILSAVGTGVNQTSSNDYLGGPLQQCASGSHFIDSAWRDGKAYQTYGFEYEPGPDGYLQWYSGPHGVWRLESDAIGPNQLSRVNRRMIPEEPMYIILNFGMSKSFSYVDLDNLKFPSTMYIDYVRLYQHPDKIRLSCDPEDRPTAKYIQDHARAYFNPNITTWLATNYSIPEYSLDNNCHKS